MCRDYWDEILLQSFRVFCAAKNACCFITNNWSIFMLLDADALCFYYCTFLEPLGIVLCSLQRDISVSDCCNSEGIIGHS